MRAGTYARNGHFFWNQRGRRRLRMETLSETVGGREYGRESDVGDVKMSPQLVTWTWKSLDNMGPGFRIDGRQMQLSGWRHAMERDGLHRLSGKPGRGVKAWDKHNWAVITRDGAKVAKTSQRRRKDYSPCERLRGWQWRRRGQSRLMFGPVGCWVDPINICKDADSAKYWSLRE